jgi:SAM-dependent methyltransferase
MVHLNYDEIADHYDDRYQSGSPTGLLEYLEMLVQSTRAHIILEVGCGTGYWLTNIQGGESKIGLDISGRMLDIARKRGQTLILIQSRAQQLPFCRMVFDFVFCVNALHHFSDPQTFIHEAHRVIRTPGGLAIIGMDPQTGKDNWYIYDYFPGTHEADLARYPKGETIIEWMKNAGFKHCKRWIAGTIDHDFTGNDVFGDPILQRNGTSQLSLLSDEAFNHGLARIKDAVNQAEALGETVIFPTHISFPIVCGLL